MKRTEPVLLPFTVFIFDCDPNRKKRFCWYTKNGPVWYGHGGKFRAPTVSNDFTNNIIVTIVIIAPIIKKHSVLSYIYVYNCFLYKKYILYLNK